MRLNCCSASDSRPCERSENPYRYNTASILRKSGYSLISRAYSFCDDKRSSCGCGGSLQRSGSASRTAPRRLGFLSSVLSSLALHFSTAALYAAISERKLALDSSHFSSASWNTTSGVSGDG